MTGVEHATPGMILLLIVLLAPVLVYIKKTRDGKSVYIRRIPGVDAIEEAIGRAAELGRPVSFTTGLTSVNPILYACLGVLNYVSKKVAIYKNKLFIPQNNPEALAIVEDVVRESYREVGRLSQFDPQSIVFLSESQFAYASGYMGLLHRENVASAFLFGYFAAESLILAEAGQQIGAMQVAASISPEQVAFFICTCDYTIIGEELYASSAYLSKEAVQMGSLAGQDRAKLVFLFLIIVGVGIATLNSIFPSMNLSNVNSWIQLSYGSLFKL